MSVSPDEMNSLLKTADNLQIIGLSQQTCHGFQPPTVSTPSSANTVHTISEPSEPSTVYSKKARILDATSASSKIEMAIEPPIPVALPPIQSPSSCYDEQDSPLVSTPSLDANFMCNMYNA